MDKRSFDNIRIVKVKNGWILYAQSMDVPYVSEEVYVFQTVFELSKWMCENLTW